MAVPKKKKSKKYYFNTLKIKVDKVPYFKKIPQLQLLSDYQKILTSQPLPLPPSL